IYHVCDSAHLKLLLHEEATGSLWHHLWRERSALDFTSQKRRDESYADWAELVEAVIAGDCSKGSMIMRKILYDSRDEALASLQRLRGEDVGPSRYIRD
ncbi:MAG TPA: hypothetical protein VLN59_12230, partial [Burkholderiales bacterium]|nr:hypothetical protein [Burkholderiales bacterium]